MIHHVAGIPSDGPWFRAEGGSADQPTMIRARQDLLEYLPTAGLATRIVLSWNCGAPLESGLPSSEDYEEIGAFEERLVGVVGEGAVLAFVFTGGGTVEYNFYTSDSGWFMDRLNEALAGEAVVPITIGAEQDPEWAEYRSLMRGVGLGGSAV